jgi:ArsR family transcriptional regulator
MPSTPALIPLAMLPADRVKGCCQPVAAPLSTDRAEEIAALHRALADPMRVQLVHILAQAAEPVCVCDFTAAFELSQPTISHHLAKLRDSGLVASTRRGIWSFYQLRPDMTEAARDAVLSLETRGPSRRDRTRRARREPPRSAQR